MDTFSKLKNRLKLLPAKVIFQSPGEDLNCRGCVAIITQYCHKSYEIINYANGKHSGNLLFRSTADKIGIVNIVGEIKI